MRQEPGNAKSAGNAEPQLGNLKGGAKLELGVPREI